MEPHEADRRPWADVEDGAEEYKEERCVMALHGEDPQGHHAGKVKFLLWDSGKAPGAEALKITFEETPRYSSQSLGTMGAFHKLLSQDVLTLRYAVEAAYGITLHTSHNLWPWLVKGNQGTAYQDAFDTAYTAPAVLFKMPQ